MLTASEKELRRETPVLSCKTQVETRLRIISRFAFPEI